MELSDFHKATENKFDDKNLFTENIKKSNILFEQGEKINYIYYIVEGELNIIKNELMMWQANNNEFVGLSSFFNNKPNYSYTVIACKNSKIIRIPLNDFKNALTTSPELNTTLMQLFCDRIKITLEKSKAHSNLSKRKRLIRLLVHKASKLDLRDKIILNYTSLDISIFINIPHKFVKQILLELQSKKLVRVRKEAIEIIDYQGLKLVLQMKII